MPQSILKIIWQYKWYFTILFVAIFGLLLFTFSFLGLVPSEIRDNPIDMDRAGVLDSTKEILPTRISIPKIGVNTVIANPTSNDVRTLDQLLLKGSVRYPGSGSIGKGNMFIFGHSTGYRIVNNQAYKAFNNLKDLTEGDLVYVKNGTDDYTYRVTSVKLVDSTEALVEFKSTDAMLTLSTCNTFGEKTERYVVEAKFIGMKK